MSCCKSDLTSQAPAYKTPYWMLHVSMVSQSLQIPWPTNLTLFITNFHLQSNIEVLWGSTPFVSNYWNVQGLYNLYRNIHLQITVFWNVMSDRYSTVSKFGDLSLATHFNTTVLTFCNWFRQIRTRQYGWQFGFPNSPMVVQTIIRSDKMFHYVNLAAFMLYGMRLYLSNIMYFMLDRKSVV